MKVMTLAQLLKYRNRLVQKIKAIDEAVSKNNSIIKGNVRDQSPKALLESRSKLVDHLIAVKVILNTANKDIQGAIFRIQELKGLTSKLGELDTKHGQNEGSIYSRRESILTYDAELTQPVVDAMKASIEAEIDTLQERIDRFNHTTEVQVPDMPTGI